MMIQQLKYYKSIIVYMGTLFITLIITSYYLNYLKVGSKIYNFQSYSNIALHYLKYSLLESLIFMGVICTILFFLFYIKRHNNKNSLTVFITLLIIFMPLIVAVGSIAFIPYYIYSIVKYIQLKKQLKDKHLQLCAK